MVVAEVQGKDVVHTRESTQESKIGKGRGSRLGNESSESAEKWGG